MSDNNVDWYQTTTSSIVSGVDTLSLHEYRRANTGSYGQIRTFTLDVPVTARGVRVYVYESGVSPGLYGTVSIKAVLSDEK